MLQGIIKAGRFRLKSIRKLTIITGTIAVVTFALLCSGLTSALTQDEASVRVFLVPDTLQPGQSVTIQIFFISNSTDDLQITNVGIHFDWMPTDGFYGYDLSSAPVTIASGSGPYAFSQIIVTVPANVTSGVHTYFVGIDGTQGTTATLFSWSSSVTGVEVGGNNTAAPTPTNSGGQPNGSSNLILYGAIAAVVIIVVLLIIVLMARKKRTKPAQPKPETKPAPTEPEKPSPEKNPGAEQDINI